jgi:hypothetical protein
VKGIDGILVLTMAALLKYERNNQTMFHTRKENVNTSVLKLGSEPVENVRNNIDIFVLTRKVSLYL